MRTPGHTGICKPRRDASGRATLLTPRPWTSSLQDWGTSLWGSQLPTDAHVQQLWAARTLVQRQRGAGLGPAEWSLYPEFSQGRNVSPHFKDEGSNEWKAESLDLWPIWLPRVGCTCCTCESDAEDGQDSGDTHTTAPRFPLSLHRVSELRKPIYGTQRATPSAAVRRVGAQHSTEVLKAEKERERDRGPLRLQACALKAGLSQPLGGQGLACTPNQHPGHADAGGPWGPVTVSTRNRVCPSWALDPRLCAAL